ncbi:MAG: arylsulfatase [Pirellulales bacterium]
MSKTRPTMFIPIFGGVALLLIAFSSARADSLTSPRRPNIVFILTDDQGYGDLACHGNPVLKTPNLDRLHREAVRFTDFQVSPTCAPTRSALLTGRHEFRNGITHTILERERLTLKATTLAQVLQANGYATGIFGKWHLGDEDEYQPMRRGFDETFIHGAGGIGQTYPGSCGDAPGNRYFDPAIWHNDRFVKTQGYCTDVFFRQAETWIEATKGKKPFFCYIATNAPHAPLDVPAEYEARYADKVAPNVAKFFGMIANIDDNVGRLLEKLAAWELERETLVIFMNDNGGTAGVPVFNAGLRATKGTPWLGGTRASSFWRWPGTLAPRDVDQVCAHIDFFPTIAELTGSKLDDAVAAQVEGRSMAPLLRGETVPWPDRPLVTHVGRWPKGANPRDYKYAQCSVRFGPWHLVSVANSGGQGNASKKKEGRAPPSGGSPSWQLYHVLEDRGEQRDVAGEHLETVQKLATLYDQWWDSVQPQLVNEDAVGPAVNPYKVRYERQFGPPADK